MHLGWGSPKTRNHESSRGVHVGVRQQHTVMWLLTVPQFVVLFTILWYTIKDLHSYFQRCKQRLHQLHHIAAPQGFLRTSNVWFTIIWFFKNQCFYVSWMQPEDKDKLKNGMTRTFRWNELCWHKYEHRKWLHAFHSFPLRLNIVY